MAGNINRVIITGNLTRDPEIRSCRDLSVCELRMACNGRRRNQADAAMGGPPQFLQRLVWGHRARTASGTLVRVARSRSMGVCAGVNGKPTRTKAPGGRYHR